MGKNGKRSNETNEAIRKMTTLKAFELSTNMKRSSKKKWKTNKSKECGFNTHHITLSSYPWSQPGLWRNHPNQPWWTSCS